MISLAPLVFLISQDNLVLTYLELCISDTDLKISQSLYCFTTKSHGIENISPDCGVQVSLVLFMS